MKKQKNLKWINIIITSIMLISTILTPQMSHAIAGMQSDETEETSEVEPTDVDAINEEPADDVDDSSSEGDSAVVVDVDGESEPEEATDETQPVEDDEVVSEEPEDVNVNSPPVEEETETTEENKPAEASLQMAPMAELGNIFMNPRLTLNDEVIQDGDIIDIDENTVVQLVYDWNTENLEVFAEDTASIVLPDIFRQVNVQNQPVLAGNLNVGTYDIVDGQLTITFNENVESGAVSNGFVGLNLNFELEKFEENIEQRIVFNDRDETTLDVIARPNGEISGITKGVQVDREMDAREITWTVDVLNGHDNPISDATLRDILPEGLGEARDFVIHELSVGLHGDKYIGNEVNLNPQVNGNEFTLEFDEIAPFNGYRVQYTTTIEDYSKEYFTNNAELSYGETELSVEATTTRLRRSNPIEKSGEYDWDTGQIRWVIIVNESGGVIDEAIVDDNLPKELTLAEGTIVVEKYTSDWDWLGYININETDFPINLGRIEADEIYRIEFMTDIDWSLVNNGDYQHHNQFTNQTELYDGDIKVGEDSETIDHWRDTLLEKSGASNVDYDNKTLTWTIEVNKAKHPLNNVVVNDVIPEGLSISEEDIVITNEDKELYPAAVSVNGQNVTINLGNIGTDKITIQYTTTIEDFAKNEFNNKATLDGDGVGEEDHEDNQVVEPPVNTFGKDFRGMDYNEKTMNWGLTVHPIREAITELTIVDTFPNKGMILLPETLVVRVGGEEVKKGFTLSPNTVDGQTGYHKGFIIEFDDNLLPLNAQMDISYQTSYDPQREVDENILDPHVDRDKNHHEGLVYLNKAQFTGKTNQGHLIDINKEAQTTIREDSWNSGKKEGQLVHEETEGNLINGWTSGSERKIAWQLYTNYQKQDLGTRIVIEDTLGYEGIMDEGSVIVSIYEVAANGEATITDEVLDTENYSVEYGDKSFTLTFAEDFVVAERYVVQFTTTVPNISQPNYRNNATVKVGDQKYPYSGTVNYDKHDHFLEKGAVGLNGNQVYTGDEVDWQITVNESLSIVKNAEIIDTISEGLVYVGDSLAIETINGREFVEGKDYTLDVSNTDSGETVLTITLDQTLEETLVMNYKTVVTATDSSVNNAVDLNGEDIEVETITSEQLSARQFSWIGGDFNPNRGAIRVTKVDAEENVTIENNEATFSLWYELNGERVQYTQVDHEGNVIPFTTENGILEIGNLPIRTYYLIEAASPEGYVRSEDEIEIKVEPFGDSENYSELTIENTKEKVDITGTKVWTNGPQPAIELQLFRDGEAYGAPVVLEASEPEYTWTNLDKTNIDGKAYNYTVDEVEVPENYVKSISDDGLTITNEFVSPLIEIPVQKVWDDHDNQDGARPESVEVTLLANGEETDVDHLVLSAESNWQGSFTDLPELDETGEAIEYTIREVNIENGYESLLTGNVEDGFTLTNSREPELINVSGDKIWDDAENQDGVRPTTITVNLLANGAKVREKTVTADDNWHYEFTSLPKYEAGQEITYLITENTVERYTTTTEGYDITNSYTPAERSVTVTKQWNDANNQDGKRPESVDVQLFANGVEYGDPITLSEENDWNHTWIELAMNAAGEEIAYSVEELNVHEDYDVEINSENLGNIIITNNYTPEVTEVSGEKIWEDADNQDGIRPETIVVHLLANGKEIDRKEVTADDNWRYTFTDLPVYQAGEVGQEIEYTIAEEKVENYEVSYDGYNITNSYTPEVIEVSGAKTWEDADNQDGVRPDSITVRLLANGEEVESIVVTNETDWEFEFTNLPKYQNGEEINYTIQEDDVEGYSTEINGMNIVNSYTPGQTSINVVKAWDDAQNQDGIRPGSITVKLLANGKDTGQKLILTAENNWQGDFTELDLYSNGELIEYTIEEITVDGYTEVITGTSEDGFVITNSYKPETPEKPGKETPTDSDSEDPKGSEESDDDSNLPKTGEAATYTLLAFILVGLGFGLRYYSKRRTNE